MDASITEVQRTERGGLPVLYAEHPSRCFGTLIVRTGMADEALRTAGITHMVEHLALFPFGRTPYTYNGRVEDTATLFWAEGEQDEVLGFFTELGRNLAELPVDRLPVERKILLTESDGRDTGVFARMLAYRYGPVAYGMIGEYEHGLGCLEADAVSAWARERFTTGNSALWLSFEPPADLDLGLPPGERVPPPAPETIPGLTLPAEVLSGTGGVALAMEGARSSALGAGISILSDRAYDRLRRDEGVSYSTSSDYHPLDGTRAHVMLQADCKDRSAEQARDALLELLDELAEHGPTEDELSAYVSAFRRHEAEPEAILARLDNVTRNLLDDGPQDTAAELLAEYEALTPSAIAAALTAAKESLLVLTPSDAKRDEDRFARYDPHRTPEVTGDEYPPSELWAAWGHKVHLTVGDEGVTMVAPDDPEDEPLTLRWRDCVGYLRFLSGSITMTDRSGAWLHINPHQYAGGLALRERLDAALADVPETPLTLRERAYAPIVDEQVGPIIDAVAREVDGLQPILDPDEELQLLAGAIHQEMTGLVVLTDQRLLFRMIGAESVLIELPRDGLEVKTKGLLKRSKTLVATSGDETLELKSVLPAGRLDELLAATT